MAAVAVPATATAKAGQETRALNLSLDLPLLHAFAEAVLPAEIGADGVRDALRDFVTWMNGFEPVAELPHPYLSSVEVQYGPPHPRRPVGRPNSRRSTCSRPGNTGRRSPNFRSQRGAH